MIHQLVGHAHKINCVRFSSDAKSIVTASNDRSIKVWDITRNTYRQTTTMRHGSVSNCIDISAEVSSAVSGHIDGGLRFWDLRTSDRTADISSIHCGGITSVEFDPSDNRRILTNGMDSTLKIVDIRMCVAVQTFQNQAFRTTLNSSGSCFSPDGTYVTAGSTTTGDVFIWRVADGQLEKTLTAHDSGVVGVTWGRGTSAQQVATVDHKGMLVLWS